MELLKFRVTNFRSVEDSGWITVGRVGAFIGVNESGKTNLLLPLWKLNPAREGDIQPTSDYPKKLFGTIRAKPASHWFITAIFNCRDLAGIIAEKTGADVAKLSTVQVSRSFSGAYHVRFPDYPVRQTVSVAEVGSLLDACIRDLGHRLINRIQIRVAASLTSAR